MFTRDWLSERSKWGMSGTRRMQLGSPLLHDAVRGQEQAALQVSLP